jgi:predicted RNase H-like nuclease (RuvC/YqgF family)
LRTIRKRIRDKGIPCCIRDGTVDEIAHRGQIILTDLEEKFAEIEKRVRGLVTENRQLKARVQELEKELALARRETQQFEHLHGKKLHIKEKIEKILRALENAEGRG